MTWSMHDESKDTFFFGSFCLVQVDVQSSFSLFASILVAHLM